MKLSGLYAVFLAFSYSVDKENIFTYTWISSFPTPCHATLFLINYFPATVASRLFYSTGTSYVQAFHLPFPLLEFLSSKTELLKQFFPEQSV